MSARWTATLGGPIFFSSSAAGMLASTAPRHERISPAEAGVQSAAAAHLANKALRAGAVAKWGEASG